MTRKDIIGYVRIGLRATFVRPFQIALRSESGGELFRDNFLSEGLIPTSAEDRERLREAGRCIHCGLCDSVAPELPVSPSLIPLVFSRTAVELPHAAAALAVLLARPDALLAGEQICPTRVPLLRLARWLSERLDRVRSARHSPEEGHEPTASMATARGS
ncbi:MAG: hypothetical protein ACYCWW_19100 [Deltaproteobacteria bacterium]